MSKNGAKIPPPNVHPELVNVGGNNMPRPGGPSSFNLEQAVNRAPLDMSNGPEDAQYSGSSGQQPPATSDGTRPEHLTIAQAAEQQQGSGWEHGDEERVKQFATGKGAAPAGETGGSQNDDDQEKHSGSDAQQQRRQRNTNTVHPVSEDEVYEAMEILHKRLPPELVTPIIDFAEYYVHAIIGRKQEERSVSNSGSAVYLTCRIPHFDAFDSETAGKGGRKEKVKATESFEQGGQKHLVSRKVVMGRQGRVRKLIFKIKSHDQGWTSNRGMGTYIGSYSWLDIEVYRKKSAILAEKAAAEAPDKSMAKKTVESEQATTAPAEGTENEVSAASNEENDDTPMDAMAKIDGPYTLQTNVHGKRQSTEHVIVWDWLEDQLDDADPEKWEPEEHGWHRGGHLRKNGAFVRNLRGGDELRIIMKCKFPGWSCIVESCEVEAVWAV